MSWCQSRGLPVRACHPNPAFRCQNPRSAEHTLGGAAESMGRWRGGEAPVACSPGWRPGLDESVAEEKRYDPDPGQDDSHGCWGPELEHPLHSG